MSVFGRARVRIAALAELERVEGWIRTRYALAERDIVLVSEQENRLPGFPRVETVISFWDDTGQRYRLRVFKTAGAITENDLPISWLKPSLRDDGDADCC